MTEGQRRHLVHFLTVASVRNGPGEIMRSDLVADPERARGSQGWLAAEYEAIGAVGALDRAGYLRLERIPERDKEL